MSIYEITSSRYYLIGIGAVMKNFRIKALINQQMHLTGRLRQCQPAFLEP
jgi:hypothetical protein